MLDAAQGMQPDLAQDYVRRGRNLGRVSSSLDKAQKGLVQRLDSAIAGFQTLQSRYRDSVEPVADLSAVSLDEIAADVEESRPLLVGVRAAIDKFVASRESA